MYFWFSERIFELKKLQKVMRLNTGWCLILFKVSVFTAGSYEKPHKQEWGFHTAKVINTLII